jgi:hypothetical protein
VRALIEVARRPDGSEWNGARRERILREVLARVDKDRERRRLVQAYAAGASTVVVVGLLLRLLGGGFNPPARSSPELAGRAASHRLAAD